MGLLDWYARLDPDYRLRRTQADAAELALADKQGQMAAQSRLLGGIDGARDSQGGLIYWNPAQGPSGSAQVISEPQATGSIARDIFKPYESRRVAAPTGQLPQDVFATAGLLGAGASPDQATDLLGAPARFNQQRRADLATMNPEQALAAPMREAFPAPITPTTMRPGDEYGYWDPAKNEWVSLHKADTKPEGGPKKGDLRKYERGPETFYEEYDGMSWVPKSSAPTWAPEKGRPRVMYNEDNVAVEVQDGDDTTGLQPKPYKPLMKGESDELTKIGGNIDTYERLDKGFQDKYVGMPVTGDATIWLAKAGAGDKELGNWWQDYQTMVNAVRNEQFGAALTPSEATEFEKAMITPGMSAKVARDNMKRQVGILKTAASRRANGLKSQGYAPRAVENYLGRRYADLPDPMAAPNVGSGAAGTSGNGSLPGVGQTTTINGVTIKRNK